MNAIEYVVTVLRWLSVGDHNLRKSDRETAMDKTGAFLLYVENDTI